MSGRQSKRTRAWLRVWPAGRVLLGVTTAAAVIYLTLNGGAEGIMNLVVVVVLLLAAGASIWLFARRRDMPLAQRAGLILDGLSDAGFVVLHDVRLDGRDLEYVVFGPPGVTVIRTENDSDAIIRRDSPDGVVEALKQLHEDVSCLRSHLKSKVDPLLVSTRELELEIPNSGELVAVARLEDHLRGQPTRLDENTVSETVIEVLRATSSRPTAVDDSAERDVNSA